MAPLYAAQTIYFYYTYNVPEGGEHTTMNDKHSFVVGNCVSAGPADLNGDGMVNLADFSILALNWLHNNCGSANTGRLSICSRSRNGCDLTHVRTRTQRCSLTTVRL